MPKEIEVKIYHIDVEEMRRKLLSMGKHYASGYQRIYTYTLSESLILQGYTGYVRARKEINGKITMAIKKRKIADTFALEDEVVCLNSLVECADFLESLNLRPRFYIEKYREQYRISGVKEINLDTLPGLPTYLEIEADTFDQVKKMARMLDCDESQFKYGTLGDMYHEAYGILPELFIDPVKFFKKEKADLSFKGIFQEISQFVTKNKQQFNDIAHEHMQNFFELM